MIRICAISCIALALALATGPARSAEITKVIDAFDTDKPFDGILSLSFEHVQKRSLLLREWICQTTDNADVRTGTNPLCPDGNAVVDTRQLSSSESTNTLNVDLRLGLAPDLEIYVRIPFILAWQSRLAFDSGVSGSNSLVDSPLSPALFRVPYKSDSRAGMGDISFGMKVAPFHSDRDPLYPSWVIGLEYLAPTAAVRKAGKDSVGGGVHALNIYTAISRRVSSWAEPWFEIHGTLRMRAGAPFDHQVTTQTLVQPGNTLGLKVGAEFFPWREPSEDGQYIALDVGFNADYRSEGREFTELFDALGSSDCDPEQSCPLTLYTRYGARPDNTGTFRKSDGVTDVEQYGVLGGHVSISYQPSRFVKLRLGFAYQYVTSHFLTFADAGKDLDKANDVQRSNNDNENEYNPKYIEHIDDLGRRFRVDDSHVFKLIFSVEGQI